jgi:uncharacterized protein (DUF305 family)
MKHHLIALATLAALGASPALALDLPPICTRDAPAAMDMGGMSMGGSMSMMPEPDQAHADLMAGMEQMNSQMDAGATAADIDVAFVCSMLPHHQGAIDMAKAELAHGDDPWARELAQAIIDAQTKEIADMLEWLGKQPQ